MDGRDIRPRILDLDGVFTPYSEEELRHAKESMLFLINRLKGRGLLLTLFTKTLTYRDLYTALSVVFVIDHILSHGGNYDKAFREVAYSDYDIANLAFLWHVEDRTGFKVYNEVQLQTFTNIHHNHAREIRNSFLIAMEAQYRIDLGKILADGGTCKDLLKTNPEAYGLSDSWESVFYKTKTKDDLICEVINRHECLNNSKDFMSFRLLTLAEIGKHGGIFSELIKAAILSTPVKMVVN